MARQSSSGRFVLSLRTHSILTDENWEAMDIVSFTKGTRWSCLTLYFP